MDGQRCGIITFHTPVNYGAVLQATALFSFVSKLFGKTEIVDYDTKELRQKYPFFRRSKGLLALFWFFYDLWFLPLKISKKRKFRRFLANHCIFSKKYKTYQSIKNSVLDYDVLLTGSDQVFRPNRDYQERNVFYLDLKTHGKKISYAASFGGVNPNEDVSEEIKRYLSDFAFLSVREKSGVDILRNLGFSGQLVLDPVFLLNKDEWKAVCSYEGWSEKNYILYYALIDNPTYHHYVERLASLLRKKVIVVGDINFKPFTKCRYIRNCGPAEFVRLVDGADYVFTSSFHGVAFSLIFEKQFFSIEEDTVLKDRAFCLMNELGVPYLSFYEVLELCKRGSMNYIDYGLISQKMTGEIQKSKQFLINATGVQQHGI